MRKLVLGMALASSALATPALARAGSWYVEVDGGAMIVEDQKLDAVVKLPGGVFKPYAGVSTAILLFTKTNSGGTDQVWFYDVEADGWSLDDKRTPLLPGDKIGPVPRAALSADEHAKNNLPDVLARWAQRDGAERKDDAAQNRHGNKVLLGIRPYQREEKDGQACKKDCEPRVRRHPPRVKGSVVGKGFKEKGIDAQIDPERVLQQHESGQQKRQKRGESGCQPWKPRRHSHGNRAQRHGKSRIELHGRLAFAQQDHVRVMRHPADHRDQGDKPGSRREAENEDIHQRPGRGRDTADRGSCLEKFTQTKPASKG